MRCPSEQQLAEYLDEMFSPQQCQRLHTHLDGCARCRQEMAALQQTAQLLHDLPKPSMPDNLWQGVAARIPSTPHRSISSWLWKMMAGIGLAASLLAGYLATNQSTSSLPYATPATSAYVTEHQLLSTRDSLSDRASIGVQLAIQQGNQR